MGKENNSKPMHKQIEEDLLDKINSGFYNENDKIPKEIELAEHYHVSRPTVRQAIQSLVNDGYLERKKRYGTIVKNKKINQEFVHVIESYDTEISRVGFQPKTNVLNFKIEKANEETAKNLCLNEGEEVYKLVRLRYAGKDPNVIATTYLPQKLLSDFLKIDFNKERLYAVLSDRGYPITSVTRKIDVMKADETTSVLLDIAQNEPIFYFHTVGFTVNHIPIEYTISKYRGDMNSFIYKINDSDQINFEFYSEQSD